jgi:hypothetical protein
MWYCADTVRHRLIAFLLKYDVFPVKVKIK